MESVESRVMAEAEADAKKIVQEAVLEGQQVLEKSLEESRKALEAAAREAEAEAASETARQLGRARHEGQLEILRAKNEVIDEVFRRAEDRFRSLPDREYLELVLGWLRNLPPDTGGVLALSAKDAERFSRELLDGANMARPPEGRFTSVVPDSRVSGGFIVEGPDFTVDVTLERRIRDLRESLAGEIARELFGK